LKSYKDNHQKFAKKAKELVAQMTLEEKAFQMKYDAPAIDRLNIPAYNWWNEGLHGVARAGVATVFPQAIGLAAMFDDEAIKKVAQIISDEARAKYNQYSNENDRDIYKGLTYWSPNINIFRDPHWGRGHETYGEDPYLTGRLGCAFIEGLQGDGEYMKLSACAKHYAVHSGPEDVRHEFDAKVSEKVLWETYLPAFEKCVRYGRVESIMGAYNRVNGEPACGSKTLLEDILRKKWKFKGHVVSDCWAIRDFHTKHYVTSTAPESAALAVKNGCDLNCGNTYLNVLIAVQEGLLTEDDITKSVERLFTTRFKLGLFADDCEYDNIPYSVVDSNEHNEFNRRVAEKSMVLLKNNRVLPLDINNLDSIAVIGPNADSRKMLKGNYHGTASRHITFLDGIRKYTEKHNIKLHYSQGCHLTKNKIEELAFEDDRISEAIIAAKQSDVVILCLGLDETIEGEEGDDGNQYFSGDKANLDFPGRQQYLMEQVVAVGKPVILVVGSGSALSLNYPSEYCQGIIQAWYPGSHGGDALANILFGKVSPMGRLPITIYKDSDRIPPFTDYSMKGRTYRYIEEDALYPFGFGLTYNKSTIENLIIEDEIIKDQPLELQVDVINNGIYEIDEVIQVYLKNCKSEFAPRNHSLVQFKTVNLKAGQKESIRMQISPEDIKVVNDDGVRVYDGDEYILYVGTCQPDKASATQGGATPVKRNIWLT